MLVKESITNYKNFRWFWINLAFFSILLVFYLLDEPLAGRGGDTFIGYAYGLIATLGIIFLMWLGIRKRSYSSSPGTVVGWVSAHIWVGLFLIVIVPLHSGFQFGMNVHSLAYGFMLATIISGMWGTFNYMQYPSRILSNRGGDTAQDLLVKIRMIENDLQMLLDGKSHELLSLISIIDVPLQTELRQIVWANKRPQFKSGENIQKMILELSVEEQEIALQVMSRVKEKIRLVNIFYDEVGAHFWLKVWLFFHLPLSFGLMVTLAIHIFSVSYYR